MPPLNPLYVCDPPPSLSVLLQGRDGPPLLPSTVRAYAPFLYSLLLWKGVPLRHPSAETATLTQLSALPLQQVAPPLQHLAMRAPPPPPIYVSLQGLGVPLLLPSAVLAYAPLHG